MIILHTKTLMVDFHRHSKGFMVLALDTDPGNEAPSQRKITWLLTYEANFLS